MSNLGAILSLEIYIYTDNIICLTIFFQKLWVHSNTNQMLDEYHKSFIMIRLRALQQFLLLDQVNNESSMKPMLVHSKNTHMNPSIPPNDKIYQSSFISWAKWGTHINFISKIWYKGCQLCFPIFGSTWKPIMVHPSMPV